RTSPPRSTSRSAPSCRASRAAGGCCSTRTGASPGETMECNEARNLIAAYVDGEGSSAGVAVLEAHLANCLGCRRERAAQSFVHFQVRRAATYHSAPTALRARVRAATLARRATPRERWWTRWSAPLLAPAAGFAVAALFASNVYLAASRPSADERLAEDIVTSHVRARVSDRPIDVVSSDRHTVKPWAMGRLAYSPPVPDFADQGYALVGGRLDYVGGRAVAALVYRHGVHVVDAFVWPDGSPAEMRGGAHADARRGYNLVHW